MIAENNLESHGTWEAYNKGYVDLDFVVPKDKPQWREMMLDRANSCYQRDKNHPAILIWSCGNESFGGKTIYEMSQLFRQLDKHRLVHYEEYLAIEAIMTQATWKARCILRLQALKIPGRAS